MPVYKPQGVNRNKSSAVKATQGPLTTQQITVDLKNVPTMRAVVGSMKNSGSAQPV